MPTDPPKELEDEPAKPSEPEAAAAEAIAAPAEEAAVEPAPAEPAPAAPVSPAKEWGMAVVLMAIFAAICFAFLSYLRN